MEGEDWVNSISINLISCIGLRILWVIKVFYYHKNMVWFILDMNKDDIRLSSVKPTRRWMTTPIWMMWWGGECPNVNNMVYHRLIGYKVWMCLVHGMMMDGVHMDLLLKLYPPQTANLWSNLVLHALMIDTYQYHSPLCNGNDNSYFHCTLLN